MIDFKGSFVRIITCMANMFQCMKNFLGAMVTKPFLPFSRTMEKLHLYTAYGLFLSFIIIASVEFLGQPINCTVKARGVVETQPIADSCWYSRTFCLPPISSYVEEKAYTAYYRWSPIILLVEGLIFLLVSVICRVCHWLAYAPCLCMQILGQRCPEENAITPKTRLFFLVCHVSIGLHAVANMFFIDWFLKNGFLRYGLEILNLPYLEQSVRDDVILTVFPRVIRCYMNDTDTCILSINVLNEKIFVTLGFCLGILSAFIFQQLFFDLAQIFFATNHHQCPFRYFTMKGRVKKVKNGRLEIDVSPGDRLSVLCLKKPRKDNLSTDPDNDNNGEALIRLFFNMTKLFFFADHHQYPFTHITMKRMLKQVKKMKSGTIVIDFSPEDWFCVIHLKKPCKDMPQVLSKKCDKRPKDTLKIDPDNKKNGDVVLIIPE